MKNTKKDKLYHTYKGVKINKPENVSITIFKNIVDECGKDYSMTVQSILNLISKKLYPYQKAKG